MTPKSLLFPPGEVTDYDGLVSLVLPTGARLNKTQIVGTCELEPSDIWFQQVIVDRLILMPYGDFEVDWRVKLFWQVGRRRTPFPKGRPFDVTVVGMAKHALTTKSTVKAPIRLSVHVRRSFGAEYDAEGRFLRLPDPTPFQLELVFPANKRKRLS